MVNSSGFIINQFVTFKGANEREKRDGKVKNVINI